jgi:hypothetical protein
VRQYSYVLSGLLESGGLLLLWLNASPAAGPVQLLGDVELGGCAGWDLQHVAVAHRHLQAGVKEGVLESGVYKEKSSIFADQWRPRNTSPNAGGGGSCAGSQPISTAVHIT